MFLFSPSSQNDPANAEGLCSYVRPLFSHIQAIPGGEEANKSTTFSLNKQSSRSHSANAKGRKIYDFMYVPIFLFTREP
jgi:hypothetical protein